MGTHIGFDPHSHHIGAPASAIDLLAKGLGMKPLLTDGPMRPPGQGVHGDGAHQLSGGRTW
jgi:hypothetical protein